jgi:fluoride exporter
VYKIVLLMVTGAVGTLARYGLQGVVQKASDSSFPWGTLAVNLIGCFIFGFIWALAEDKLLLRPENRSIILIGFLGSFTTFSSFVFETSEYLRDSQWALAICNIAAQNILGIVVFFAGLFLGRLL